MTTHEDRPRETDAQRVLRERREGRATVEDDAVAAAETARREIELRQKDFANVLPLGIRPETFVRLAIGVVRRDPELARVAVSNRASFYSALMEAARLGHDPGTKRFALARFGNEVVGIETYQGAVTRLKRDAGAIVHADLVREHDHFVWNRATMKVPEHAYDPFLSNEDRGPVKGGYAYAEYADGRFSEIVFMNMQAIDKRRRIAKTRKFWDAWPEEMQLKTIINRLENFVGDAPTDEALGRLAYAREAVAAVGGRLPSDSTEDIEDAELVED